MFYAYLFIKFSELYEFNIYRVLEKFETGRVDIMITIDIGYLNYF